MPDRHPDAAYLAIVASGILLLLATVAGRMEGDSWDTISDMITRNPRLRNAFSIIVGWVVLCQIYYVTVMYQRWTAIVHKQQHDDTQDTPRPLYLPLTAVLVGIVASVAGSIGFATISTDISSTQHEFCAGTAFLGIYVYLVAFAWLAVKYGRGKHVVSLRWACAMLAIPWFSFIAFAIAREYTSDISHYLYVWEFLFVSSALLAACALYVYPIKQEQKQEYPQAAAVLPEKGIQGITETAALLF